jgi:hypothetical protein
MNNIGKNKIGNKGIKYITNAGFEDLRGLFLGKTHFIQIKIKYKTLGSYT